MSKSNKGGQFERDIARTLSLWWTNGERDNVFWRSSMSGGRATVRARKGQNTNYLAGDLTATDPIGAPLIESTVIELKRGYARWCILDLVDSKKPSSSVLAGFLDQVEEELKQAKVKSFLLICKRDGREAIVIFPIGILAIPAMMEFTYKGRICEVTTLTELLKCKPEVYLESAISNNTEHV